jgi:phosphoribosylaminoimidazolecarboxamide formyltransferase/IMP cyclohydrolase
VAHKRKLIPFARFLSQRGVQIVSTGGTSKTLQQQGIPVLAIEQLTGFPEILGGRVKTLHPRVHGALLAKRDDPDHVAQMKQQGIESIDLVVVNLYPSARTIARPEVTIGKPSSSSIRGRRFDSCGG